MVEWEAVSNFVVGNTWAVAAALIALIGAAITAYAQDQIRAGARWALRPIAEHLPWNLDAQRHAPRGGLRSDYTLVQLFIRDAKGERVRYEKTSAFIAIERTTSYEEAVTADHSATGFSTMRGTIIGTAIEHGFHVSKIDLGNTIERGERLINVYSADLLHSFPNVHERWTQEFVYPTKRFTLLVHFPEARPPKSMSCSLIDGFSESPAHGARLVELFGRKSIAWEICNPNANCVLKLEWGW